ncbi:unnamed protein product [Dibothriocephalus latus]|uniref:Cadherin domain-containing protein n=1 Tax=Dibothriocephalus latus TaxID=60516 RepID=A0A3P6RZL2_DIBLA|nr:unnamed protein product [Dibothriocephalus latus]
MHTYRLSIRVVDRNSALPAKSFADMQLLVYTYFQPVQFPLSVFTVNFSEKLPAETTIGRIPAQALNYAYDNVNFEVLREPAYAEAPMVATLIDEDDNPPFFQLAEYNSDIVREDVVNDTAVLEVMPDDLDIAPENRRYQYSISGPGAANFYVVSAKSGAAQIRTTRPLRYDTLPQGRPFYEFSLRAASPVGDATTLVRVRIQNVNRNVPLLNPIPPLIVFRDIAPTSAFVQLSASDADGSGMRFYFFDKATNNLVSTLPPFRVNDTSGNVYVTTRPELKTYFLQVVAEDDGSCPGCPISNQHLRSEPMTLEVKVVDRNSHAPTFSVCPPSMKIMELAPAGTVLGQVNATDEDDKELSKTLIKYTLIGNTVFSMPTKYLKIDVNTGVITNVLPLLRLSSFYGGILPDQLYFTVKATDWGVPEYWNLCNFQLIIEDINHHAPVFDPATYELMVERNHDFNRDTQTKIGRVVAVDLDQPGTNNSEIFYAISTPVSHFTIDSRTGEIMVSGMLTEPEYNFTVVANNSVELFGPRTKWNSATVIVRTTTNSSLLPPQLKLGRHLSTFPEDKVHILVAEVTGTPAEGADYSLSVEQFPGAFEQTGWSNSPPPFTSELVQSTSGVTLRLLSGSNFLYQRLHQYIIRIRGCRKPTDPLLGDICKDMVLTFELEDVNNMVPQFIDLWLLNQISIPENSPNGTEVLRMFAVDTDTVPNFREVTYSLIPTTDSPKFTIQNGVLRTNTGDLDHETKTNYVVQILAQDGAPSSFGSGKPNSVYAFQCASMPRLESFMRVFKFKQADPIVSPESAFVNLAQLHGETCSLRFLNELRPGTAIGCLAAQTETSLTIHILDVNDNTPYFINTPYIFNVSETAPIGYKVGQIMAEDNDDTAMLVYLLKDIILDFAVNSVTGEITVARRLDYDNRTIYLVTVIATNEVGTSYAVINVTLQDVNDEYPRWPYPNQTIPLPENTQANSAFARLTAPDADIGENTLSYYSSSSGHNDFQVSTSGEVRALKTYDYERDGGLRFYLPITATNIQPAFHSNAFYSATGTLTVTLVDVNDRPPTLVGGPSYEAVVPESAPVGVDVFTFLISDPDVSDRGLFECVLAEPNAYFNVTFLESIEACGVRPTIQLLRQGTPPPSQLLNVVVYDSNRLHSVQATVRINVTEDNVLPPDVSPTVIDQLFDGAVGLLRLCHIRATSPESQETSFTFLLDSRSSAGGMFGLTSVMPESVQLSLIGRLDRETLQTLLAGPDSPTDNPTPPSPTDGRLQWPLILTVSDQREPARTVTTTLTLTVRTQGPLIPPASLSGLTVPNKAPVGTDVKPTDISAKDLDFPNQDTSITYSIAPEVTQAERLFSLFNGPSGSFTLKTKVVLDRDTERTATVLVPVIAVGAQSRSATSTLTVTITDSSAPNPDSPATGKTEVYIPEGGILYLKSASPPGLSTVVASVSTTGQSGSTTSTLEVTVRWMDGTALLNGLVFQVAHSTADWFVTAPLGTNSEVPSPRDRVVAVMANDLGVPVENITMFPIETVGTSFNVFVGVHGSPYQVSGR